VILHADIAALIPHAGAMVLLDHVAAWDAAAIRCGSRSHLDAGNPLRRDGRLAAICGVEYGLQAAALHGALLAGGVAQQAGYLARLREVALHVDRLDDDALGTLVVEARLERQEMNGMVYALSVAAEDGRTLVAARASIALPAAA
jgi:predicted hotdog family 3-hydroxylacyl-ACP dehydratase